jgi:hypothetical protein
MMHGASLDVVRRFTNEEGIMECWNFGILEDGHHSNIPIFHHSIETTNKEENKK